MNDLHSLASLSESQLLSGLKNAVTEERKWTQLILEYLLECDRRGLHLKLGFASLHEFAVQYLGFSDGAAHRRIQSMRLMTQVPEVAEKISSGALTLSNAAKLQTFFMAEKRTGNEFTHEQMQGWVEKSITLPSRGLEREILKEASAPVQASLQERTRDLTPELTELRLVISAQLREEIEELKHYLSHSIPDGSVSLILERLIHQELERQRKRLKTQASSASRSEPEISTAHQGNQNGVVQENSGANILNQFRADAQKHSRRPIDASRGTQCSELQHFQFESFESNPTSASEVAAFETKRTAQQQLDPKDSNKVKTPFNLQTKATPVPHNPASAPKSRRFIPSPLRREIWNRAGGQCEAKVRTEGSEPFRRCSARRLLQIDHIQPISLGGESTLTNLRLLCAHHNRLFIQKKI
jgi:hypothetical protein